MASASTSAKKPRKKAAPKQRLPDLPKGMKLPAVKWVNNDRRLNGLLLKAIEENKFLKRAIWLAPGEATTSLRKAVAYRELAKDIFSELPPFSEYFKYKSTLVIYGTAVKNQIARLKKFYHAAKNMMGVTGGGLDSEEEISADTPMMDKWNEAKKECPDFYRLKDLLGERMNVSSHTINNSSQSIDLTSVLPGNSRRSARGVSEDEATMDPDAAAEEDDLLDAEADDIDNEDLIEITEEGTSRIAIMEASPRKDKGKQKKSRSPSPNYSANSLSTKLKRGSTEFEHLLEVVEQGESRKRCRDEAIEHTKRLESQEETRRQAGKDAVKLRRLDMEMAEREAIRQHELSMKSMELYGVTGSKQPNVAMPLEGSMKRVDLNTAEALTEPVHEALTKPISEALEDISNLQYQQWMTEENK